MTPIPLKRLAELRVDVRRTDPDGFLTLDVVEGGTGRLHANPWESPSQPPAAGFADVESGDVLFGKLRPYLAKVFHVDRTAYASTELMCLRAGQGIRSRWLFYRLLSKPTIEWAVATSEGTKMPRTSWERLSEFRIEVPPETEQRAIADYLDTQTARVDALITYKKRFLRLLRARESALLSSHTDTLTKAHGLVPIRRLATRLEQGSSPVCDQQAAEVGEWGVLKTSAVSSGNFTASENKRLQDPTPAALRWQVLDGDLLVARGSGSLNSVGQAVVAETEGAQLLLSDLIYRLTLARADPDFVALMMGSSLVRQQIHASIRSDVGQTLKLRADDILELRIPATPHEEQRHYTRLLTEEAEDHRAAGKRLLRQIELLREHRQALITAAVTGELDVPGAA